jgi:hypothetical protein
MTRLVGMVESLVASNAEMRLRMDHYETEHARNQGMYIEEGNEPISQSLSSSAFESDLDTSRVYRKLRPRPSNWSISTSQQGSMALTAFSQLTMDDVSNLSILRLPVWSMDLSNTSDYDFDEGDLTPKGSPIREPYLDQDYRDNSDSDEASDEPSGNTDRDVLNDRFRWSTTSSRLWGTPSPGEEYEDMIEHGSLIE